jgi:hypothetical protein
MNVLRDRPLDRVQIYFEFEGCSPKDLLIFDQPKMGFLCSENRPFARRKDTYPEFIRDIAYPKALLSGGNTGGRKYMDVMFSRSYNGNYFFCYSPQAWKMTLRKMPLEKVEKQLRAGENKEVILREGSGEAIIVQAVKQLFFFRNRPHYFKVASVSVCKLFTLNPYSEKWL